MPCQDVVHSLFGFTGSTDDETLVILQHLKPVLDIGCIVAEAFLRFSVQSLEVFLKFFSFPTAIHCCIILIFYEMLGTQSALQKVHLLKKVAIRDKPH